MRQTSIDITADNCSQNSVFVFVFWTINAKYSIDILTIEIAIFFGVINNNYPNQ